MIDGSSSVAEPTPVRYDGPRITVAICSRNRATMLVAAVHSVLPQITPGTDILIVDNASTDDTARVASKLMEAYPCISAWCEKRVGLSYARNAALVNARGHYVIFLDDDATAQSGWLAAYRRFLSVPPASRIAVVGGAVIPSYEVAPPHWLAPGALGLNLGEKCRPVRANGGPWGGNSAYEKNAALQVGGFDTGLGRTGNALATHEDYELNLRLEFAGFSIWWLPTAQILHRIPARRLQFSWLCRGAFQDGRCAAIVRASQTRGKLGRVSLGLGRLPTAPFHCAMHVLVAGLATLMGCRQRAASALLRGIRNAGFAYQLAIMPSPYERTAECGQPPLTTS